MLVRGPQEDVEISEQMNIFENKINIFINASQQLHHCRLAVVLLSPDQMKSMHNAMTKVFFLSFCLFITFSDYDLYLLL
jgi:hypothetical protein